MGYFLFKTEPNRPMLRLGHIISPGSPWRLQSTWDLEINSFRRADNIFTGGSCLFAKKKKLHKIKLYIVPTYKHDYEQSSFFWIFPDHKKSLYPKCRCRDSFSKWKMCFRTRYTYKVYKAAAKVTKMKDITTKSPKSCKKNKLKKQLKQNLHICDKPAEQFEVVNKRKCSWFGWVPLGLK